MPAERELATALGVSCMMVAAAYEALRAGGCCTAGAAGS
jgi:DNA-binding transcriptional regulator YhcF (GntR family)